MDDVLGALIGRELVALLPRRPGQKEQRFVQLLGTDAEEAPSEPDADSLEARVARLEAEVRGLREALEDLSRRERQRVTVRPAVSR